MARMAFSCCSSYKIQNWDGSAQQHFQGNTFPLSTAKTMSRRHDQRWFPLNLAVVKLIDCVLCFICCDQCSTNFPLTLPSASQLPNTFVPAAVLTQAWLPVTGITSKTACCKHKRNAEMKGRHFKLNLAMNKLCKKPTNHTKKPPH